MATLTKTAGSVSLFARIDTVIAEWRVAFDLWREYRNTLAELRALSTRELNDLGMSSASIPYVAHEAVYGGL